MSTITTRSGKGSPLTNNEVDSNFTNLNTDKLESADLAGYATLSGATFTGEVEATGFNGDLTGAILFKGQAGEALTKGDPVYISGISGNKTVVSKADANDANKMPCFGIVDATVSANADCSVVTFGTLQGLDTSSFSEGDELFVSDTGTLTTTAPTGESSQLQKIGKVTRSHASTGSIKVMGAGRTNAVPNLNDGQFFLGNGSNQAVSTAFSTSVTNIALPLSGGALTGAVTTNSTFDGRDVATDGAKLDGIEASADVTDTANVTAAGALMDSELTSEASVKALNQGVATTDSPTFAGVTLATADINAGSIDGTAIGASSASTGAFTTLTATGLTVDTDTLYVDSTNNRVGIGTTTVNADLHINKSSGAKLWITAEGSNPSDAGSLRFSELSDGNNYFEFQHNGNDNKLNLTTSNGDLVTFDRINQRVGIGATSPAESIHTAGNIRLGDSAPAELYTNSSELRLGVDRNNDNGTSNITFYVDNSEKMRIDSSGRVGIGTSAIMQDFGGGRTTLALKGAGSTDYSTLQLGNYGTSSNGQIHGLINFYDGTTSVSRIHSIRASNTSDAHLVFYTAPSSGGITERMRIDSSGNVGIGTSSPSTPLDVDGSGTGIDLANFGGSAQTNFSKVNFNTDALSSQAYIIAYGSGNAESGNVAIKNTNSSGDIFFTAGNAERARIDSSGNVGIGTTSPDRPLDITDTTSDGSGGAVIHSYLPTLELDDISGGGTSFILQHDGTSTLFKHDTTERMRIDSSGNLLVGQTSVSSGGSSAGNATMYVNGGIVRKQASFSNFNEAWASGHGTIFEARSGWSPSNKPNSEGWFHVKTIYTQTSGSNFYLTQTCTTLVGRIYTRYNNSNGSSSAWSSWVEK